MPVQEYEQARGYPRFVEISDDEGNMHQVDLEAKPDIAAIDEYTRNPNNNVYLLYTRYVKYRFNKYRMYSQQDIKLFTFNRILL